ncbi:AraC family transcriptional regulator [Aquimarina sp. 2201CG5-10]|uniref:helix-turn-helix domain-containing protein n=1 Tax=Aquimarina callyspongiae TaxID=3098150 RepID=UPI002AB4CD76|nr:AraC family transcriptional regulator [Aquimarina sp. 2201CG5-10]MDY8137704.1 AraC family transcriptional regulator [Aquimarina sp. 2201CG5-10]
MKILAKGTYYGAMHAEQQMNGVLFSEYDYLTKKTDWHFHENPYFMYVLQGNLYDVNKRCKTTCPSGSFLLHNWQEPHFNSKESTQARGFHIEFEKNWFEKNNIDIDLWEGSKLIKNPKLHHILAKLYAEFKYADAYSEISSELLISELCQNIEKEKIYWFEKNPPWLVSLIEIIHLHKEPFNLKSLSQQLGIHPGHLSRAIPKYFSTTLGDYIRQVKIKRAIDLMLSSNASLSSISYECGFSDQSHFSRTFKRYMGMMPKEFYKKCR